MPQYVGLRNGQLVTISRYGGQEFVEPLDFGGSPSVGAEPDAPGDDWIAMLTPEEQARYIALRDRKGGAMDQLSRDDLPPERKQYWADELQKAEQEMVDIETAARQRVQPVTPTTAPLERQTSTSPGTPGAPAMPNTGGPEGEQPPVVQRPDGRFDVFVNGQYHSTYATQGQAEQAYNTAVTGQASGSPPADYSRYTQEAQAQLRRLDQQIAAARAELKNNPSDIFLQREIEALEDRRQDALFKPQARDPYKDPSNQIITPYQQAQLDIQRQQISAQLQSSKSDLQEAYEKGIISKEEFREKVLQIDGLERAMKREYITPDEYKEALRISNNLKMSPYQQAQLDIQRGTLGVSQGTLALQRDQFNASERTRLAAPENIVERFGFTGASPGGSGAPAGQSSAGMTGTGTRVEGTGGEIPTRPMTSGELFERVPVPTRIAGIVNPARTQELGGGQFTFGPASAQTLNSLDSQNVGALKSFLRAGGGGASSLQDYVKESERINVGARSLPDVYGSRVPLVVRR